MEQTPAVNYIDAESNGILCKLYTYGMFSGGMRPQDVFGTLLLIPLCAVLLSLFKHQSSPLRRAARIFLLWPLGTVGIVLLFRTLRNFFGYSESLRIAYNGSRWVFSIALSAVLASLLVQGISAARKEKQGWIRAAIALVFLVLVWLVWLVPEVWVYFNCS
jgi:hypothetical protein